MQLAGVAPGCDSRRASAPRHGAPTAARGHARRCPCASRPRRHPRRTALRPLHARTHPPGSRRAPARCVAPAPRPAWAGNGPQPQARPRSRRTAHPARPPAHGSVRKARHRHGWRRDRPCRLPGQARVRAAGSSRASATPAPDACHHGSVACGQARARTRRHRLRVAGRHREAAAPRHHDRGTRPGARRAHPERDLPASAGPKPAPRPASDDGAASRGGSRGFGASIPKPARGRSGVGRRDRPLSDTSVRRCDQSWRDLPVLGVRRHGFRRAGAIETPSGRHQKG